MQTRFETIIIEEDLIQVQHMQSNRSKPEENYPEVEDLDLTSEGENENAKFKQVVNMKEDSFENDSEMVSLENTDRG